MDINTAKDMIEDLMIEIQNLRAENRQLKDQIDQLKAPTLVECVDTVVGIMNSGKADPLKVYPPNRYHGD
jgi:predicted  nucleic acid-binding Zn-ribbon protein